MNIRSIFFCALMMVGLTAFAQHPTAKPVKFKPPVVYTILGEHKDSANITVEEAKFILSKPLVFKDAKGGLYGLSSYTFVYNKVVASEDDAGKPIIMKNTTGKMFTESPLPKIWVESIGSQLHSSESLHFTDVIVKMKDGKVIYAKGLKLKIVD